MGIERELEAELKAIGSPFPEEGWFEAERRRSARVAIEVKRRKWASGGIPQDYQSKEIFLFARAMIFAFDLFGKTLRALITELTNQSQNSDIIDKITDIENNFTSRHPHLRHVRDSSQHKEDRVRGLKRNTPIPAIQLGEGEHADGLVKVGAGGAGFQLTISEALANNIFHTTMADGHIGSLNISLVSVSHMHTCFQNLINVFDWTGDPVHRPN